MTHSPTVAMPVLLAAMPDGLDWPRLLSGHRELLRAGIRDARWIPGPLIDLAFARRDESLFGDITANNAFLMDRPGLRARLAATGSRHVAGNWAVTVSRDAWTLLERRALFANADPHDGDWYRSLDTWPRRHNRHARIRAGVTCRVRNWAGYVVSTMGRELTAAEQARAALSIVEIEGPEGVKGHLERGTLWTEVAAACVKPDTLPGLTERLESAEGLVPESAAPTEPDPDRAESLTLAATMVGDMIGADTDAWAVALAMLPDFTGTLPELLRTASAVVNGGSRP